MENNALYGKCGNGPRGQECANIYENTRLLKEAPNLRVTAYGTEGERKLTLVSGIRDQKVLRDLVRIGVTAESLLAMRYVPMVFVSWADRAVSSEERKAILQAVTDEHITIDSAAYRFIAQWLEQPPTQEIITAWKEYVGALAKVVPSDTLKELQTRTATLCERVAKAAGGILGFGKISAAEQAVIQDFIGSWAAD